MVHTDNFSPRQKYLEASKVKVKVIDNFSGKYRFLSNFYPAEVELDGVIYPSVENAYQAAKTLDTEERNKFTKCNATSAKRLGRNLKLRDGWEKVRVEIMAQLIHKKFQYPELREKLIATGTAELVEGNWWGDTFWGVCKGKGQNKLGSILMLIREVLSWREEKHE